MKANIRTIITAISLAAAVSTIPALAACGTTADTNSDPSAAVSVTESAQTETMSETSPAASDTEKTEKTDSASSETAGKASSPSESDIEVTETVENTADGEHAVTADNETVKKSNILVNKTGEADGDEADFYGENAALFATNGGTLDLSEIVVKTNGTHANGVFSYGEGTTVNISDSYIETEGNCSGGLMTTGGGTMNAENLTIKTSGNSSAAIRSDRGGGTVTVTGGSYTTSGVGSPVIYSTADITVNDAEMTSTASQGVVVEGKNSVTLNNVTLNADNNKKNGSHSDYYQAVMLYQSMSGDAAEGLSSFTMKGGSLTNQNGDIFFVNNTTTQIDLTAVDIENKDSDGVFLRAAAAGWGSEGSNGGQVTLNASKQTIDGDMIVDSISNLNFYLKDNSTYTGAVNSDGEGGGVYVEIEDGSTWKLTGDSYITGLTCSAGAIDLNGHTLYINGEKYTENSASAGTAIDMTAVSDSGSKSSDQNGPGGSGGTPPEKPSDNGQGGPDGGGAPPEMPGNTSDSSSSGSV